MKLSIIMPVYNEEKTLLDVVKKVVSVSLPIERELIIVEGGSTDNTKKIMDNTKFPSFVRIYHINKSCGKGYKVRFGIKQSKGDIILIQDADLEYDPADYAKLIKPILDKKKDFVLGSRHLGKETWRIRAFKSQPIKSRVTNVGAKFLDTVFNIINRQKLTDPQTMYKVFRKKCLDGINLKSNFFDLDWEIVIRLIQKGYLPLELPVTYNSRSSKEGKKIKLIKDGFRNLFAILRFSFTR